MIKLSIAVLLSVEVKPFVCFHELNLSEIFLVLLVPYFDLYLSAMPEFCRICTRLKIKKDQKKTCFKLIDKGHRWKYINLRVQGLPFTSDGAYD